MGERRQEDRGLDSPGTQRTVSSVQPRFSIARAAVVTGIFAAVFALLKFLDAGAAHYISTIILLVIVAVSQLLFRSKPRAASVVAGAVGLAVAVGIHHPPFWLSWGCAGIALCGGVAGYVIGALLAGVFLLDDSKHRHVPLAPRVDILKPLRSPEGVSGPLGIVARMSSRIGLILFILTLFLPIAFGAELSNFRFVPGAFVLVFFISPGWQTLFAVSLLLIPASYVTACRSYGWAALMALLAVPVPTFIAVIQLTGRFDENRLYAGTLSWLLSAMLAATAWSVTVTARWRGMGARGTQLNEAA
jgi:hypothetical protein